MQVWFFFFFFSVQGRLGVVEVLQGQDVLELVVKLHLEGCWVRLLIKVKGILMYKMFMSFFWSVTMRIKRYHQGNRVTEQSHGEAPAQLLRCLPRDVFWLPTATHSKAEGALSLFWIPNSLLCLTGEHIIGSSNQLSYRGCWKTQLCSHNSTFIFIFRRKYLSKLPFGCQKVKTFLIGMVPVRTCNFF